MMNKEEALKHAQNIVEKYEALNGWDSDKAHIELDELMETLLIQHGYNELVELIRKQDRRYV